VLILYDYYGPIFPNFGRFLGKSVETELYFEAGEEIVRRSARHSRNSDGRNWPSLWLYRKGSPST